MFAASLKGPALHMGDTSRLESGVTMLGLSPQQVDLYESIEKGAARHKDTMQSIVHALAQRIVALESTTVDHSSLDTKLSEFEGRMQQMSNSLAILARNIQGEHDDVWEAANAGSFLRASIGSEESPVSHDAHNRFSELSLRLEDIETKMEAQRVSYEQRIQSTEDAFSAYQELCELKIKNIEGVVIDASHASVVENNHVGSLSTDVSSAVKDVSMELSKVKAEALNQATSFIKEMQNRILGSNKEFLSKLNKRSRPAEATLKPGQKGNTKLTRVERTKMMKTKWKNIFGKVKTRAKAIGMVTIRFKRVHSCLHPRIILSIFTLH
jgi:hypothetical protein